MMLVATLQWRFFAVDFKAVKIPKDQGDLDVQTLTNDSMIPRKYLSPTQHNI